MQRVAAYALALRRSEHGEEVLLTRNSVRGPHPGQWTLPGGGIDHGEEPRQTVVREVREETGLDCTVGEVLEVGSTHFEGTAPSGRREDYHALQMVFRAEVSVGEPVVLDVGGTTDAVAWVATGRLGSEQHPVRDLVHTALAAHRHRLAE
jgi:8-oxo-dGTP diphosphatase